MVVEMRQCNMQNIKNIDTSLRLGHGKNFAMSFFFFIDVSKFLHNENIDAYSRKTKIFSDKNP